VELKNFTNLVIELKKNFTTGHENVKRDPTIVSF